MKRLITFLCIQVSIALGILGAVTKTFDDESVFPAFGLGGITATQHTGAFGEWTLYDGNGMKVYGLTDVEYENKYAPSAWMVFNRAKTNPVHGDGKSHSGHQCMMSVSSIEDHVPATTDHWLISPELSGEAQTITFYARQLTTQYGNEKYEVLASSTNNTPTSFTIVGSTREITGEDWQEVSVSLPAGSKYFAIRHISYDIFAMLVDDITYEPKGSSGGDDDPSGGSFFYYQNEDGTLTITHAGERWHGQEGNQHWGTCCSYAGDIVIPEEIDGKTVTAVGKAAFWRSDITSLKLPKTLKLIADEAFLECRYVKDLAIPASVDSIGRGAFNSWDALESVTIEDSPNVLHTGSGGYSVMSSIFSDQPLLKKAYVGRNHKSPLYGSMGYEVNLFAHSHLQEITYGDYVTEIQQHELIECNSLKKVNLGKNITSIGALAFSGCDLISSIDLPAILTSIGEEAFVWCPIETIRIPASVSTIEKNAFRNTAMKNIYCYGTIPAVCNGWIFEGISKNNMTLHYPQGTRDAYKAAECWKEFFDDHAVEFDASGINAITIDDVQNCKVYNLKGQQVDSQTTQKGLYILNGKKIIRK